MKEGILVSAIACVAGLAAGAAVAAEAGGAYPQRPVRVVVPVVTPLPKPKFCACNVPVQSMPFTVEGLREVSMMRASMSTCFVGESRRSMIGVMASMTPNTRPARSAWPSVPAPHWCTMATACGKSC